ncbi:MAG: molybdopterin-dependent oxidoreductase, partial [Candidatus Rokubacteria bacterium]|nr:molybdopterin-dependent oxidoreductase [Candidatus Rokubacteria bacterium]
MPPGVALREPLPRQLPLEPVLSQRERFPPGRHAPQSELAVTRHCVPRHQGFAFTNGIQLSYVEVDVDTGFVRLLGRWAVEDCGRIINNPRLPLAAEGGGPGLAHVVDQPEDLLVDPTHLFTVGPRTPGRSARTSAGRP